VTQPLAAPPADNAGAVSEQTAVVLSADEIRLLTEIGFVAAGRGDVPRARQVFEALAVLRPQRAFPRIGLAVALLNAGQAREAVEVLERAPLQDAEERAMLDAWRGFALQLAARRGESLRVLSRVAAGQGEAAALARSLLGRPGAGDE